MKRIYAVLGALCALIMFNTSSAFAQGWNVYRYTNPAEMAVAGKVLASVPDSVVVDYTEMDPLNIPGIQIIPANENAGADTIIYTGTDVLSGYFYLEEGEHFVTCDNPDAVIRGIWMLAPGAKLSTNLAIGGEGELTQILGNGAENEAFGPIYRNTEAKVYNTVIAGSGGIKMGISSRVSPSISGEEYTLSIEKCYITECGNTNAYYLGWGALAIGVAYDKKVVVKAKNVRLYNNHALDIWLLGEDSVFHLLMKDCDILTTERDPIYDNYSVRFDYNSSQSLIEFIDCRFIEQIQTKDGEILTWWWMKEPGIVRFYETRPSAFVSNDKTNNLATLWPRETSLVPEDLDGDESLTVYDVICVAQDFGASVEDSRFGELYDFDNSGVVDLPDIEAVARAWLNIPIEYSLSQVASDPAMLEAIKHRINQLIAYLPRFYSASKAMMEDPEFGALITAVLPTAVLDEEASVPSEFSLEQNYPNPFNAQTQIRFSIPESGFVELVVYDVLGRVVHTLVSEPLEAGTYTQTWDGRGLNDTPAATGVYMYVLRSSTGQRIAGKMVLAR